MNRLYADILPKDLILQLSLYLNYRDIWQLCNLSSFYPNICFESDFWLNKIRNELGYNDDFIKEYVFDKQTNEKKTLLPLNEKYIELKSRNNIDFGSEYYLNSFILGHRASRVRDFDLAKELVLYFENFNLTLTAYNLII